MSKPKSKDVQDRGATKYPSEFGSHKSMISQEWTDKLKNDKFVILECENGFYATTKDRLDSRLADPHRYALAEWKADRLRELLDGVEVTTNEDNVKLKVVN